MDPSFRWGDGNTGASFEASLRDAPQDEELFCSFWQPPSNHTAMCRGLATLEYL